MLNNIRVRNFTFYAEQAVSFRETLSNADKIESLIAFHCKGRTVRIVMGGGGGGGRTKYQKQIMQGKT